MDYKKMASGSITATIGFILSPLSWWNDAFVNIPIAYACANIAALINKKAFLGTFVIAYWATNIAGFALLHKGIEKMRGKERVPVPYSFANLGRDIAWTLVYTLAMVFLVRRGIVRPFGDYLK
jgi:hypothetical protein